MLKLIHTSDWHFGQTLRGHDRTAEHEYFITQLIEYITTYQPDALLISGDLYDSSNANAQTDFFFRRQILRIRQAAPSLRIIMIAGNHDGYAKQEADNQLWQLGNISVVGNIATKNGITDYDRHIIRLDNKAFILPVPFTRFYPPMPINDNLTERKHYFYDQLLSRVAIKNETQLPVIMMGHLNYEGAEIAEQESLIRGGEEATQAAELGSGFDYLAMGHIHYPQTHGKARYSGSPIPINFSEGYEHSITLVQINRHGEEPQITVLPLKQLYGMKKILQKADQTIGDFMSEIEQKLGNTPNYLRLGIINDNESLSDKEQIIKEVVEHNNNWIYCGYDIISSLTNSDNSDTPSFTPQQLENNDPIELAEIYYKEQTGENMNDELRLLLQEAINNYQQTQSTEEI